MLIIVIGIVIVAVVLWISSRFDSNTTIVANISTVIVLGAIALGLLLPTGYKDEELVEEIELVSLSNSTSAKGKGIIYVSITGENSYSYRHEVDSNYGTTTSKEYVVETISEKNGNIVEVEDPNCEKAVIQRFVKKSKITIWSFGFGGSETTYVIYVPEGSIVKEISLN